MITDEIIALAKEKFGKDITREEAENYLSGKTPIPDEVLEQVSGGLLAVCEDIKHKGDPKTTCPVCRRYTYGNNYPDFERTVTIYTCNRCGINFQLSAIPSKWIVRKICPKCGTYTSNLYTQGDMPGTYRCSNCGSVVL